MAKTLVKNVTVWDANGPVVYGPTAGNQATVPNDIAAQITSPSAWSLNAASEAAMLALSSATVGDVCIRTDTAPDSVYILTATPPATLGNWTLLNPQSVADAQLDGVNLSTQAELDAAIAALSGTYVEVPDGITDGEVPTWDEATETWIPGGGDGGGGDLPRPEDYGAVGDGVTDDSDALFALLASGEDVQFTKDAVYLNRRELYMSPRTTIHGNLATIKRKAQVSSTTTTDVAPGTNQYVLADATGFEVGMSVAFANSTVAKGALATGVSLSDNNPVITAINGNTITVTDGSDAPNGPNITFTATANVYSVQNTIWLDTDCKVLDVVFDGNKANVPWSRWEVQAELHQESTRHRTLVRGCRFFNIPGEGYQPRGDYVTIENCVFEEVEGNGIHFAAATHPVVTNCRFINCNLDLDHGHVDGGISFSSLITDAWIVGNYMKGCRSGVGGLSGNDANHVIANNFIVDCTTHGLDCDDTNGGLVIVGNHIRDCGAPGAVDGGIYVFSSQGGVQIVDNWLENCDIQVKTSNEALVATNVLNGGRISDNTAGKSMFRGNFIIQPTTDYAIDIASGSDAVWQDNFIDLTGNTTLTAIKVGIATNHTFTGNTVLGGANGIAATSTGVDVVIRDNTFYGQSATAINVGSATGRFEVIGNSVTCTSASAGAWRGINIGNLGVICQGNVVRQVDGTADRGIRVAAKAQVVGNTVLGTYTFPISIVSGTDSSVVNNLMSAALQDIGTTTQLSNNIVVGTVVSAGAKAIGTYTSATVDASMSVDASAADVVDLTLATAAPVLTITNLPAGDSVELVLRQDATGSRVPTFAHASLSFKWPGGAAPTLSTAASTIDRIAFENTGAEICGTLIGKAFA